MRHQTAYNIVQAIDAIGETINPIDEKLNSGGVEKGAAGKPGWIERLLVPAESGTSETG